MRYAATIQRSDSNRNSHKPKQCSIYLYLLVCLVPQRQSRSLWHLQRPLVLRRNLQPPSGPPSFPWRPSSHTWPSWMICTPWYCRPRCNWSPGWTFGSACSRCGSDCRQLLMEMGPVIMHYIRVMSVLKSLLNLSHYLLKFAPPVYFIN